MKRQHSSTQFEVVKPSEYEKMVLKNKAEKDAFLKSIKIDEVKESLKASIANLKPRGKPSKHPLGALPSRERIHRLAKVDIDLSEAAIKARAIGQKILSKSERAAERRKKEAENAKRAEDFKKKRAERAEENRKKQAEMAERAEKRAERAEKCRKKQAEVAKRRHKKRCMWAFEARIAELHSLVNEECKDYVISRHLFEQKIKDLVGINKNPADHSIGLEALPAPGSREERLVVETCILAEKYACSSRRRHVYVTGHDISLAINNLYQHNIDPLDHQQLKDLPKEDVKNPIPDAKRPKVVLSSHENLPQLSKVHMDLSEETLEFKALTKANNEVENKGDSVVKTSRSSFVQCLKDLGVDENALQPRVLLNRLPSTLLTGRAS